MTRYRTIVADPPWRYDGQSPAGGPNGRVARARNRQGFERGTRATFLPYRSMELDEIAALPVAHLAEPDAHLYLWTTNRYLPAAFDIVSAWGFRYSKTLVWCKTPMGLGLGGTWSQNVEYVLVGRRGTLPSLAKFDTGWWNWKRAANGQHSAKPDAFLDMVEQASPGPYVELFARRARFGWDYWGDQSLGTTELPEAAA